MHTERNMDVCWYVCSSQCKYLYPGSVRWDSPVAVSTRRTRSLMKGAGSWLIPGPGQGNGLFVVLERKEILTKQVMGHVR